MYILGVLMLSGYIFTFSSTFPSKCEDHSIFFLISISSDALALNNFFIHLDTFLYFIVNVFYLDLLRLLYMLYFFKLNIQVSSTFLEPGSDLMNLLNLCSFERVTYILS